MDVKLSKLKWDFYGRKSSEGEDRQVQSLDDQRQTMMEIAARDSLIIDKSFSEAKSAKIPRQRPQFDELISRIEKGETNAILCWHINRLARNPLESGIIGQLFEDGKLEAICTHGKVYLASDNVIVYNVDSAQSIQFSKELSVIVKRGQLRKAEKGGFPGKAPHGYINEKDIHGNTHTVPDPERYDMVRKMWDLALTGQHSQQQIANIANEQWGFRTIRRRKTGGTPISKPGIYKMFANPFYMGLTRWKGVTRKGIHQPMVSLEEYERVHEIFNKTNRPRSSKQKHAYCGLISCECGCMITAETKTKHFESTGNTGIYTYYRCTKRKKGVQCDAKPI